MRFKRPYLFLISGPPPPPLAFFRLAVLGELPHWKKDPSYATDRHSVYLEDLQ